MSHRDLQVRLGVAACVAALFLVFFAIPHWVSSPSNVRNVVLSPLFWPYVIGGLTGLVGLGLVIAGHVATGDAGPVNAPLDDPRAGLVRLASMAVMMIVIVWATPRLGMVWTSMLAFAAMAFLVRTRHPRIALICAVLVPLVLYAFFAHVASIAIPQGNFVRLP